jgi:hypothetical protein
MFVAFAAFATYGPLYGFVQKYQIYEFPKLSGLPGISEPPYGLPGLPGLLGTQHGYLRDSLNQLLAAIPYHTGDFNRRLVTVFHQTLPASPYFIKRVTRLD